MAKKPAQKREDPLLLTALKFVMAAQAKDSELAYQTHCRITPHGIIAYDGSLAAGHPCPMDFNACPQTAKLISALEKVDGVFSMAFIPETNQLSLKAGKLTVRVSCLDNKLLDNVFPDAVVGPLNDNFRRALDVAGLFTREGDVRVVNAALQVRDKSVVGTNGKVMIEVWHGIPMPGGMNIPKKFAEALDRTKKKIVSYGYSQASFTVYFDDGAWLRTQLYQETLPNVDTVLAYTTSAIPIKPPEGFFDGIRACLPHISNGGLNIYFGQDQIQSHRDQVTGAVYQVPGIVPGVATDGKNWLVLEPVAQKIDFLTNDRVITFSGELEGLYIRGVVSKAN